ncbi:MAG: protein kinase [Myxococcota bacterium]
MSDEDTRRSGAQISEVLVGGRPAKENVALKREVLLAQMFPKRVTRPKLGRYDVLEFVGEGGMGTVFAAYDSRLDRRVAVKLLRQTRDNEDQRKARLMREAKALARLSHQNIVTIHEVWEEGGEIYLAMEFVQGQSLAQWQRGPKPWREVLEVYAQAGEGLAAAHEADMVYRDFKPHNAIRREDGVVKLLDFGLARIGLGDDEAATQTDAAAEQDAEDVELDSRLTRPGTIMGTPAYMAPEQYDGVPADARSDQFGFCVALWEALYGELPFARDAAGGIMGLITMERVEPSRDHDVPGWVRKVVERGLAEKPDERHPTMRALLRDLARDPAVRRRRVLGIAGGLAVALTAGVVAAELRTQQASCDAPSIWDAELRDGTEQGVLAGGGDAAEQTWELLGPRLERHADAIAEQRGEVCRAHRDGLVPESHFELQVACLDRRQAGFSTLVDILSDGDELAVANANKAITQLRTVSSCADIEVLRSQQSLPADESVAARVTEMREELARARAEEAVGAYGPAEERAFAVLEEAQFLEYEPLVAEAMLRWGSAGMNLTRPEAYQRLDDALWSAIASEQRQDAAEAAAKRIFAKVELVDRSADVTEAVALAESLIDRKGAADWRIRWTLANNTAIAFERRGRFVEALESYEAALGFVPDDGGEGGVYERAVTLVNMGPVQAAMGLHDPAERSARRAVAELEGLFGSDHPQLRAAEALQATVLRKVGAYAEAAAVIGGTLQRIEDPDATNLLEAARIAMLGGDYDAVLRWCAKAKVHRKELFWEIQFGSLEVRVAAARGEPGAERVLDEVADSFNAIEPAGQEAAAKDWVEALLAIGRTDAATAIVQPLVDRADMPEQDRGAYRLLLGRILVQQGQWERARQMLSTLASTEVDAYALEPLDRAYALLGLSAAAVGRGKRAEAIGRADEALRVVERFDQTSAIVQAARAARRRAETVSLPGTIEPTTPP